MRKTKFKQRVENALNAFFEHQGSSDNDSLAFVANANLQGKESSKSLSEKLNSIYTFLKQALFFFPGTFVLYIMSMVFGVMSVFSPTWVSAPRFSYLFFAIPLVLGILATWYGLGDIGKTKHLIIPASIIVSSFLIGILSGIGLIISKDFEMIFRNKLYPMCIFPFVLMIPFLAKMWIDYREWER